MFRRTYRTLVNERCEVAATLVSAARLSLRPSRLCGSLNMDNRRGAKSAEKTGNDPSLPLHWLAIARQSHGSFPAKLVTMLFMTIRGKATQGPWKVRLEIWVEHSGRTLLGQTGFQLLERVAVSNSLSDAARHVGISYRHAWGLVQQMSRAAGSPLLIAEVGGLKGGGSVLTTAGKYLIARFRLVHERLAAMADSLSIVLPAGEHIESCVARSLFAAASLHDVLMRLTARFTLGHPDLSIRSSFGPSSEMANHILAGATADLFFSADEQQMDRVQTAGLIAAESRVDRVANRLVVICPQDSSVTIRRSRDLLNPELRCLALSDPTAPLGNYTREYLRSQGLHSEVMQRAVLLDNPRAVLAAVDSGQADAGVVYQSDLSAARAVRLAYRVPSRDCPPIRYPFAITSRSERDAGARVFCTFILSEKANETFRSEGFVILRS
jgi:molybdate transport system substrate-binding protein